MQKAKNPVSAPGDPIRSGDQQNVDQLIPKLNLFFYADKETVDKINDQGGIYSPSKLLQKFPNQQRDITSIYSPYITDPIKKLSVMAFFSRVPIDLPNTKHFVELNTPVRISISKILRAKQNFKVFGFNFPGDKNKLHKLTGEHLTRLVTMESKWYKHFKDSKDPYFRDVPQAAIYSEDGFIPSFAVKILHEVN